MSSVDETIIIFERNLARYKTHREEREKAGASPNDLAYIDRHIKMLEETIARAKKEREKLDSHSNDR